MKGTHHFRTTVQKGIDLFQGLSCSGNISGRAKPKYAAMTDIGKIMFYETTIIKKYKNNHLLLQSHYKFKDRKKWVSSYVLPKSSKIDKNGYLQVFYLDGE